MGNAVDKTFRSLSPVTWVDTITNDKTYYNCPSCGRRVWAYGSMAGTKCLDCPGSSYKSQSEKTIQTLSNTISTQKSTISTQKSTISTQKSTITTYKTAQNNLESARDKSSKRCKEKRDIFIPKIDELTNKYKGNECETDQKEPDSINLQQMDHDQDQIDQMLQDIKTSSAKTEEFIKLSKDIAQNVSQVPTYQDEQQREQDIDKLTEAQEQLMNHRKTVNEQNEIITTEKNKVSQTKIDIENELITTRNAEKDLNKDEGKMDKLRLELGQVTGSEINANPEAFNEMKQKFDDLCKLLRTKHGKNKEKMTELKECEKRVKKMEAKLIKQHSDNKYLADLLDEEYKRLGDAVESAMTKFEERGKYFLAVTVGLKQDVIEQLEDIVGDDHDMDMIKMMTEQHLINAGILDDLLRGKILKKIAKLNAGNL